MMFHATSKILGRFSDEVYGRDHLLDVSVVELFPACLPSAFA